MDRSPLGQLFSFASRRHGVFTVEDAARYHVTEHMLQFRARQHVIERLHRGVYRVVGAHDEWHQRVMAALVRCGSGAVASHRTAAALYRLDGFPPGPIDVIVGKQRRAIAGVTIYRKVLVEADRTKVGVIPATTPIRALLDLSGSIERDKLVEALDAAERDGRVQRRQLITRLEHDQRPGTAALRDLLRRREAIAHTPRSVVERRFLRALAHHGLPVPVAQYPVQRADGVPAYLDFAFPSHKLGIELQSNAWHATPEQRAADYERQNLLTGWRFLSFTYEDVMLRPHHVATVIALNLAPAHP
jgi:hypothetical protein